MILATPSAPSRAVRPMAHVVPSARVGMTACGRIVRYDWTRNELVLVSSITCPACLARAQIEKEKA